MKSIATILAASLAAATAYGQYAVTDLGSLGGESAAWAINDARRVVGVSMDEDNVGKGISWDAGVLTTLHPHPPLTQAQAMDVAPDGSAAVLSFSLGHFGAYASLVSPGATADLGAFAPRGIGADGRVLGTAAYVTPAGLAAERACAWDGTLTLLDPLAGAAWSLACDSNIRGWAVGHSIVPGSLGPVATLWIGTTPSSLGTLGGAWSSATAINKARQVVGVSATASGAPHAFRFKLDADGVVTARRDMGTLAGDNSAAYDINDAGAIVGVSHAHAALWVDGAVYDLNDLIPASSGWVLQVATGINAEGSIVGWGVHGALGQRAFLLTASCPADCDGSGVLNVDDVECFVTAFLALAPAADCDGSGVLNVDDVECFVASFLAGCP